ncbi:MAG: MBL fold metallo-hydrolase RNA specificity domain-containing protein [Bacillota bacterium]
MKITFLGAAEVVTGSCYLCEFENTKLMVDCGMFQGGTEINELNFKEFTFNPAEIDYLLLTHAHIDHSGRIPQLVKKGFKGKILCTTATQELCSIMLPDSAYIQEMETEWLNRKRKRAGKHTVEPIYKVDDAVNSMKLFTGIRYNELIELNGNISVRFRDAGHILGSAMIEMWIQERGEEYKIVFSGDIGNKNAPLMQDASIIEEADYVIMETTYGNRMHKDTQNKALQLLDIITDTVEKGGNIVIPSFAIERTQEILFELNKLKENKAIKLKNIPVYVDSPLAINATRIFENNTDYLDDDTKELLKNGDNPFEFSNLLFTETSEESKAINATEGSAIIISASGMCEAGRIKHHLKHNLWRPESSIVFVGYQARGSLGRRILEGEKTVKIFGEEISIKSNIYSIEGFSGHADQDGLKDWLKGFKKKPTKIFLVHGEEEALKTFSGIVTSELGMECQIASLNQTIELTAATTIEVVKERFYARKESVLNSIDSIKKKFGAILSSLQSYVDENEDIRLDTIYHLLDNIDNTLECIKSEVK